MAIEYNFHIEETHQLAGKRLIEWLEGIPGNIYQESITINILGTPVAITEALAELLENPISRIYSTKQSIIYTPDVFIDLFANVRWDENGDVLEITPEAISTATIEIFGVNKEKVNSLLEIVKNKMDTRDVPNLIWYYKVDGRMVNKTVSIKKPKPINWSFYPYLQKSPEDFMNDYMASDSPILVLLGPPGTGKTNLINNMIWKAKLKTSFTYEDDVLKNDQMFAEFITGNQQLLIMEDADTLLGSREHQGNGVMNKFLNIGDGLIQLKKKKMIFSANIKEKNSIDEALLRPGRCFACIDFRALDWDETQILCKNENLVLPPKKGSYTLAEIFAVNRGDQITKATKVGF